MTTDAELLQRYLDGHSEAAFADLVRRHLGLVYSVALRRVGHDAHLARDVCQIVFTDLARKARSLTGRPTLGGWLYGSAHVATAQIVRTEQRRKTREGVALALQQLQRDDPERTEWERLRPVLDDLVFELRDEDREAVVLRYFAQRTFAEIGSTLNLSEEAARKRVDRSLDKLRAALTRRGLTSTSAAIGAALGETAIAAVPAGLIAQITAAALAPIVVGAGGASLLAYAFGAMKSSLFWTGLVATGGVAAVLWQHRQNERDREELTALSAENRIGATLREDNRRLAAAVAEGAALRRAVANRPAVANQLGLPATSAQKPVPPAVAIVTVNDNNTINWGDEPVKLAEFAARLKAFRADHPEDNAKFVIWAKPGATASSIGYVMDQARLAQITKFDLQTEAPTKEPQPESWF